MDSFVTVSDRVGLVGAFESVDSARVALRKYAGFPFVFARWPLPPGGAAAEQKDAAAGAEKGASEQKDAAAGAEKGDAAGAEKGAAAGAEKGDAAEQKDAAAEQKDAAGAEGGRRVWTLPFLANRYVAAASTDRAVVEAAQAALLRLELVPPDDLRYWEAGMGEVLPAARRRLDSVLEVRDAVNAETPAYKTKDREAAEKFLDFASRGGAPSEEEARIDLLEGVVPAALPDSPRA